MIMKTGEGRGGYYNTEMTEIQAFAYKSVVKQGYSVKEVAEFMDISRNSVYTHLKYAERKLRMWPNEKFLTVKKELVK